ncbi:MAG: arginine N-succinyltransferase [Pseudomonadota bacterium]
MFVRPITGRDLSALKMLAEEAGVGFTSLHPHDDVLNRRISCATASFSGQASLSETDYLFVLELDSGEIGGCCAIIGAVGLDTPWYQYRLGLSVRHSERLKTNSNLTLMFLTNDLTGSTEICSLLLSPKVRGLGVGRFLAKSRFLFMANFPYLFAERCIAEMRGCINERGIPPFWEAVGSHFFKTSFNDYDVLTSTGDRTFISEMMLTHPLYLDMLPDAAREVIGEVQADTLPALHMLESEGFKKSEYVDIADAGPVMISHTKDIRSIQESRLYTVRHSEHALEVTAPGAKIEGPQWMVANTHLQQFRVIITSQPPALDNTLALDEQHRRSLGINVEDTVRVVKL